MKFEFSRCGTVEGTCYQYQCVEAATYAEAKALLVEEQWEWNDNPSFDDDDAEWDETELSQVEGRDYPEWPEEIKKAYEADPDA